MVSFYHKSFEARSADPRDILGRNDERIGSLQARRPFRPELCEPLGEQYMRAVQDRS